MATPNPSSECSDSEQPNLKVNSMERLAGGDLPASQTVHQDPNTTFQGYVCRKETTTFYEGSISGSTMDNIPIVEEPEDPQRLGRCMDRKYDLAENPKQTNGTSTDLEDHPDTVSVEGEGAEKVVTDSDQKINQNLIFIRQCTDPINGWPEFAGPEPMEEVATEDTKDAEGKVEIKSNQDEHQEDDELLANCENQNEKVLMESNEQEEKDTEIENNKEVQGHEEDHAELGEQIQMSERSDDAGLPDPKDDDEKQNSEIQEKEETETNKEAQDAERSDDTGLPDPKDDDEKQNSEIQEKEETETNKEAQDAERSDDAGLPDPKDDDEKQNSEIQEKEETETNKEAQDAERSDDAGLPDPKDDDEKQNSEIQEKEETETNKEAQDAERSDDAGLPDPKDDDEKQNSEIQEKEETETNKEAQDAERSDDAGLPDPKDDDEKQNSEIQEKEETETNKEAQDAERSDDAGLPDPKDDDEKQNSEIQEKEETETNKEAQDADTQNHDSDKDDALQIRAPPVENLQPGSSSSPEAQVPREDLPECKPPENPDIAEVPPAVPPEGEPAEKLKTSSKGSPSVSSGELEKDDNGSDPQTTTCINFRQAFRWLRKRVLACLGRGGTFRSTRVVPTRTTVPGPIETHPDETLAALSTDPV